MENNIPFEDAKNLIIAALGQYHPELATIAADIFERDGHTIIDNPELVTGMMQCRPAEFEEITDTNHPLYISRDDFKSRFDPHFTEQSNPRKHAVIDYEYIGTPKSVINLAHELGHAIADDIQITKGLTHKDFTRNQQEEQAYFIQSIVSYYTGIPAPKNLYMHGLAKSQFEERSRPRQFKTANDRFNDSLTMDSKEKYNHMIIALAGNVDSQAKPQHVLPKPPSVHQLTASQ